MMRQDQSAYVGPIHTDRKPWGRRIEVFSPKLGRRLTLLSRRCHDAWLLLEADPAVRRFCERPDYLKGSAGRTIDFWVDRGRHKQFWVVLREDEEVLDWPARVRDHRLRLLKVSELRTNEQAITNWGQIVPYLSIYLQYRDEVLDRDILERLRKPHQLSRLEAAFSPVEPGQIRSSVFGLLARGDVVAESLQNTPLSGTTVFKACG